MRNLVSKLLILLGILTLLFGFSLLYMRQSPTLIAFAEKPHLQGVSTVENMPTRIRIPSVGINLPVIPAISNGKDWETTHLGVSFLEGSPIPGEEGNGVLYGHNWSGLLAELPKVRPGETIMFIFASGKEREFEVEYTAVVDPHEVYVIENTNDTRVTLYTCTGFLDTKRFVVVAKPIDSI